MISNNTTYKLKASKSSDFQENHQLDENIDNESVDGDATGDAHKRYNVYTSRDLRYKGVKPRQSEYKSYRGAERRGNRGRSGAAGRRNERDFTEGGVYVISRKYQDSLNRSGSNTGMYHHSKYYESDKKVEIKFNLPEDTRISKLLRRLNIEEDQENSLTISKKLLEVLLIPDNALYVRKAFHILRESMLEILHIAPGPLAKCQAARALGRMGYIMGQENDFERFQTWLFSKIHGNSENLTYLFMRSLQEVLIFERKKPVLQKHSSVLMRNLVATIEVTDNVDVFKTGLEDLVNLIELYPDDFYPLFRDTIDLLFGWHVDHTQQLSNIEFISKCLQRLAKYFKVNLEFSVTLILHFLEDIEGYSSQLHKRDETDTDADSAVEHVTVFILALNTVLKCLGESFNPNNESVTVKFITDCLMKIIQTTTDALESFVPDNLTIASNECISILLSVVYTKPTCLSNEVLTLVDVELSLIQEFSNSSIVSTMLMISKVIKELSANLPIELISKLLGPDSEIIKMRQSPYVDIREATICVYQSLLNLKNIPLLQEAYKYILGDLELVYRCLVPNISSLCQNNPFTEVSCERDDAENVVLFLLRCLSQLANVSGSIIGMWALKPSILELLGVLLEPYDKQLLKVAPTLQYSLLYLLFSHCKCYNYFISSSTLLTDKINVIHLGLPESLNIDDVGSKSPNSGNFAIVLNVLFKTLLTKPSTEVTVLILHWFNDILRYSESYLEVLHRTKDFNQLAELVLKYGYVKNDEIVLCVAKNLQNLLNNKHLSWKNSFLVNVNELCILHMTSNNGEIRQQYTKLSANVPWDIAVKEFGKMFRIDKAKKKYNNLSKYNNYTVTLAQHLHMYGSVYGEMLPFQFKIFMNYILKNECTDANWLEDIFLSCWPLESDTQTSTEQFRDLALSSKTVLYNWATWEAAQFCVNTKLRTPLGKPNETLTSFEVSLKQLAKNFTKCNNTNKICAKPDVVENQIRLFLKFMDHLEVSIYNASEGSAIAIPQPSKPVRTFFTTNSSTCREWLSRIRLTVIQLALHVGQSAFALRHGQILLKNLSETNKVHTTDFVHAAMYVTWALLNLRESDALQGLYVWCKKISGKEFSWIKCSIDQANRKYEVAAEGYANILRNAMLNEQDTNLKSIDAVLKRFISEQVVNCYKQICDWYNILTWKNDSVSSYLEEDAESLYNTVDLNCVQSLFNIEIGNHTFNELTTWRKEDEDLKACSSHDILCKTDTKIYSAALNILALDNEVTPVLDDNLNRIQQAMQTELLSLPSEFLQNYCVLNYVVNGLKNTLLNTPASAAFLVSENFENEVDKIESCVLFKILWWSEYFGKLQNQGFSMFCCNLRLNVIRKARKEKNFNVAANQLYKFLQEKDMLYVDENDDSQSLLLTMGNSLIKKIPDITMWYPDTAKAVYEAIKLLYDDSDNRQLTFNLCATTSTSISKCADMFQNGELQLFSGKILLKLAKWLQTNDHVSITDLHSPLGKFLTVLPEIGIIEKSNVIPVTEMAIGKLLQFSVHQCNQELAKSWNSFGTWCYRWGRKVIDSSTELTNVLTSEDQQAIQNLLLPDAKTEDLQRIYSILSQTRASVDDEDIDSTEINTSEMIRCQLQNVPVLFNARESELQTLVQIWRNIHKRVYTYYELSAEAYFKYLHLTANSENITESTESNTVTVTLRLLRLIVKHALELQSVLEEGLASTPTRPWKIIIPQLFSRLNHPESYVRQRVSELLCRIAEDSPHLIMFPAVVGALEGGVEFDFSEISLPKDCLSQNNENNEDTEDEIDDAYDSDGDDSKNILQSCFKSMVDTLSKQAPETINEVQVLVKELRRIILLWDELWLGTLAQHHSEINKKQQQLELEIEKVILNTSLTYEEKVSLITEKHRIIIKPIIFILEQLYDITSVEPETPHEKQFQEQYSEMIVETLGKLKHPDNMDKPQESWQLLKQLQSKFQQKVNKRASYTLKMQEISPVLANMRNTVIAMPGLVGSSKTKVTISHVSNHVSILPTKTKPKKLIFHGSNGQTYTYLFKGLEDLHLDERIMQFLSITNTMMAKNKDNTEYNLYKARFYSVIPLGPRSGLISWVDGTTPVFALYKRWQQREAIKHNAKSNSSSNLNVLRPSELFYNKLNPLLQEHGVKNIENRKEWPVVVLKQVLTELMNETPSDLLAKELWCHSINAGTWWQMVRRYSYSVAVMSIIGYIIGLGDRHLDNVLVDLTSGDVVHIDYNVCFEKGKSLRVPEKVPFRLTPNIRDALGVTGIEGIFRTACENVLKTMKKGRETLLTLLEAFVYDPLIDWTLGVEGLAGTIFGSVPGGSSSSRQTRKNLEREVTLAMFNVRCAETKVDWNDNKKDILEELPELTDYLEKWMNQYKKCTDIEDLLQDLHQQMALVKEAEANGICKHPLYSLPTRYDTYRKRQDAINNSKKDLENLTTDCDAKSQKYIEAVRLLESQQISQWLMELNANFEIENNVKIFNLVKEFLQNAGQTSVITQCEQSEKEVGQFAQQRLVLTMKCLHLLQEYALVIRQCPPSFLERHRVNVVSNWCKYLLETKRVDTCDVVFQQFCQFIDAGKCEMNGQSILKFFYQLNLLYNETATQLAKAYEDLNKIRSDESMTETERIYNEAKASVISFLRHEKGASKAFEFVIVGELLLLNQSFLTLETAASRRGDWLMKLTSRDGIWFLDDLTYNSNKSMELLSYLHIKQSSKVEETRFFQILNGLKSANNMYKSLQELNYNFHTIILPESIKKIQCDDPTVLGIIGDLNSIISNVGMPLNDVISYLENNLKCIVMEMDINSTGDFVLEKVAELRINYDALLQSQSELLSPGKMLLMGFNGLFQKLNVEYDNLINTLGALDIPSCWKNLDQVKEAKSLAAPMYNTRVRAVLDDIFIIKRLQAMSDFFNICVEMCQSFKGKTCTIFNDEQIIKPIRKFIADYISRQFLGITTEAIAYTICFLLQDLGLDVINEIEQKDIGAENKVPVDELYQKGWSLFLKHGIFTQNILAQASSLESNLKTAWEKIQEPKKLEQNLALLRSSVIRIQHQITTFNWMFEDVLNQRNWLQTVSSVNRSKFILDLQSESTALSATQLKLSETREQQKPLVSSISQRLKWAAGANPDLNEILSTFEMAISSREKKLDAEQQMAAIVLTNCTTILQHEMLRSPTSDSKLFDQLFLSCCDKWRVACQFNTAKLETVSGVEENIMRLYSPDMITNPKWLSIISEKISDIITGTQNELEDLRNSKASIVEDVLAKLETIRSHYTQHCKLMTDFKPLIKSMAKIEEHSLDSQQFIADYRKYMERFSNLLHEIKRDMSKDDVEDAMKNLYYLSECTQYVYDKLMKLIYDRETEKSLPRPPLVRQEEISLSPLKSMTPKQESLTRGQQRNAYAVGVWRRVRLKLEGRDPDPGRKYTTQEQVDYVIRESTNLDNLALLYEGWTPWV